MESFCLVVVKFRMQKELKKNNYRELLRYFATERSKKGS